MTTTTATMADKIHVNPKSAWKTVSIDPGLFSKTDFDGFISLKELKHYEVVTVNEIEKRAISERKEKKQRKNKKTPEKQEKAARKKHDGKNFEKPEVISPDTVHSKEDKHIKQKKDKKKKQSPQLSKSTVAHAETIDLGLELEKEGNQPSQQKSAKKRKRKLVDDSVPTKKKVKVDRDAAKWSEAPLVKIPRTADTDDMAAWRDLFVPDEILLALRDQGFYEPTPIQAQVLAPAIRDRLDIVGAAETGSGKTLAFGIPVLHYILEHRKRQAEAADNKEATVNETAMFDEPTSGDGSEIDDSEMDDDSDNNVDSGDESDNDDDNNDVGDSESDVDDDDEDEDDDESDNEEDGCDLDGDQSSEEEEIEELQDLEHGTGCVKVIKDVDFSWMETAETAPPMAVAHPGETAHPLALILEPTRELAMQVKNHLTAAAVHTDIRIAAIVGGLSMQKQRRILKKCPDVIVATPGRLWELIQEGDTYLAAVDDVRHLVVDEADRMVEKGHFEELAKLLLHLNADPKKKRRRHTYIFSATLTVLHTGPQRMLKKKKQIKLDEKQKLAVLVESIGLKDRPKVVDITRKVATVESLTEARINCSKEEKDIYLYYFLRQYRGRTLVFSNSKDCIRRLVSVFTLLQCCPLPLHADMHQKQRLKNLERFTANPNGMLIASDVAARGLDIPNVQHVIHFQVPHTVENYVHRSGRTARASKEGLSLMIVGPDDVKNYRKIMHSLNKNDEMPLLPIDSDYFREVRTLVNMVRDMETKEYRFQKRKRQNNWFSKSAEEIGVELDDNDILLNDMGDGAEQAQHKSYIKQMKLELNFLLRQPILPRTVSGKYPTKSGQLATLPDEGQEGDAISSVKKDRKWQQKMMARSRNTPRPAKQMKQKKSKWKKKKNKD